MTLKYPYLLLILLILLPLIIWWLSSKKHSLYASLGISSLSAFSGKRTLGRAWLFTVSRILELSAIGFLIVALARPQKTDYISNSHVNGTDIVIALDISESMRNADISPNRFDAAKTTAKEFIRNRPDDNIGLVVFAGESLSIMPLTNDLLALQNAVDGVKIGELSNGTAIGDGLVSAVSRVLNGPAVSKSIILITDGTNNTGDVSPSTAADIAALKGIKVYTIGVGRDGKSLYVDPYGFTTTTIDTPIDEQTLKDIASTTGGQYFRAVDADALSGVFEEIDKLEKTSMEVQSYQRTEEAFMPWIIASLCCFFTVLLLRFTILTKIP